MEQEQQTCQLLLELEEKVSKLKQVSTVLLESFRFVLIQFCTETNKDFNHLYSAPGNKE
jgi:hypothetical protein